MALKLKDEPGEWRKSVLFGGLGLSLAGSLLRWRGVLPGAAWVVLLACLCACMACALFRPRWFRGYYKTSAYLNFWLGRQVGMAVLAVLFLMAVVPLGCLLRLLRKDQLKLKPARTAASFWQIPRESTPLERLF